MQQDDLQEMPQEACVFKEQSSSDQEDKYIPKFDRDHLLRKLPISQKTRGIIHQTATMTASSKDHTASGLVDQPDEKAMAYATQPDWTPQEEAKAKRK